MRGDIPAILGDLEALDRRLRGKRLALFLDFDGTLAPIVEDPGAASLGSGMRDALRAVVQRWTVAIVSGRDRADVARRVGIDGLYCAGNHGLDILGPGGSLENAAALAASPLLDRVEVELRRRLAPIEGALVERKRFTIAIHSRKADPEDAARVKDAVAAAAAGQGALRVTGGKEVLEIRPAVDWDKGDAVEWLLGALGLDDDEDVVPLYVGDDLTDEDAFRALRARGRGIGILVGDPGDATASTRPTLADYWVSDPSGVEQLLRHLAAL